MRMRQQQIDIDSAGVALGKIDPQAEEKLSDPRLCRPAAATLRNLEHQQVEQPASARMTACNARGPVFGAGEEEDRE